MHSQEDVTYALVFYKRARVLESVNSEEEAKKIAKEEAEKECKSGNPNPMLLATWVIERGGKKIIEREEIDY